MEKRNLYPIGKAAEICKVSPRALRYYEEKGLIKPDEISSSRYRYYSADTLLTYMLDVGTVRFEMGYASAIAVFLFVMMMFTNFVVSHIIRRIGR